MSAAASIGGGARCQFDLRKSLSPMNPVVMSRPEVYIGSNYLKFDKEGNLTDEESKKFIKLHMEAFAEWIDFVKRA